MGSRDTRDRQPATQPHRRQEESTRAGWRLARPRPTPSNILWSAHLLHGMPTSSRRARVYFRTEPLQGRPPVLPLPGRARAHVSPRAAVLELGLRHDAVGQDEVVEEEEEDAEHEYQVELVAGAEVVGARRGRRVNWRRRWRLVAEEQQVPVRAGAAPHSSPASQLCCARQTPAARSRT